MDEKRIRQGLRFEAMLNKLGLSMYTEEWACKVIAVAYWLEGKTEAVVLDPAFHFAIRCSQQKLNLLEGCDPDMRLVIMVLEYIEDLKENGEATVWFGEICERYGLGE